MLAGLSLAWMRYIVWISYLHSHFLMALYKLNFQPSFKSTFGVKLVRPSDDGYVAFSNMPQIVNITILNSIELLINVILVTF